MEQIDDRFPRRKNPRLRSYDYTQPGYYFITICTKDKKCIFGDIGKLNHCGELAQLGLTEIEKHFPAIRVDKWVVMPNHVHAIVILEKDSAPLPVVVGQYKSAVSKQIHAMGKNVEVWQVSYHDHIIRSEESFRRIWSYIDTNPMRWKDDCFYVE